MCPDPDVQFTNAQMLHVIRAGLERDLVDTSRKYGLSAMLAERLRTMPPDELERRLQAVGPISLFLPRLDLGALLDAPLSLAGTLAASRAPLPISHLPC